MTTTTIPVTPEMVHCSTCMLNDLCLPVGLTRSEVRQLENLITERIRLSRGEALYASGDRDDTLYALRYGSIKTVVHDVAGQVQITGFLLPGEVLGVSSLVGESHRAHAIALEDSEVCVMRLHDMEGIARQCPALEQQFRRLMIREIKRSHHVIVALGSLRADRRVAAFLLNLSQRLGALGYSPTEFLLRMSREEIGNHLGLTFETVSRMLTRFSKEGLIRIEKRYIHLLDLSALRVLSGQEDTTPPCEAQALSDDPLPPEPPDAALAH